MADDKRKATRDASIVPSRTIYREHAYLRRMMNVIKRQIELKWRFGLLMYNQKLTSEVICPETK
ncbi:hypothetical protein T03_5550 [Trichinella britovi]|uniref:Uncharacterized protein n=2 Tax=Trichinella TaxID=6333 RepID=A0A0V1CRP1_TRIBR|nr:hypothetical protein T05_1891 [Trichinella murrelli]KRX53254.1 hypothetical protein T09_14715 [Trichinella sp. T9]KRX70178.1 hypothetical protein T06_7785 [Trichinella sp. T6]KRY51973.1 hypothetical protein T03_5550 [Trichinella britovi]KRZ83549.1 hypothetical protein T08_6620 [Trichinella sp. T8]